jgi:hypothetical protein
MSNPSEKPYECDYCGLHFRSYASLCPLKDDLGMAR